MPYISKERRDNLDKSIIDLSKAIKQQLDQDVHTDLTPEQLLELSGDLNYCVSRMCAKLMGSASYKKIAILTGVLENIKQELYRRVAEPYENKKIQENGDVEEYFKLS